jgi:hypothetical protein
MKYVPITTAIDARKTLRLSSSERQIFQHFRSYYSSNEMRSVKDDAKLLGLEEPWLPLLSRYTISSGSTAQGPTPMSDSNCQLHALCDACKNYFGRVPLRRDPAAKLLPPPSQHELHTSLQNLAQAAEQGCHFCSLILYNLSRLGMLPDEQEVKRSTGVYLIFHCSFGDGRNRLEDETEENTQMPPFETPSIYVSLQKTTKDLDNFKEPGETPEGYMRFSHATSTSTCEMRLPYV